MLKKLKTYRLFLITTSLINCLLFITACQRPTDYKTTRELLQAMKTKNDSTWFQHFTFKQKTIAFDTLGKQVNTSIWYEAVSYPYLFRIDRDIENGNYTIYRKDSTYQFQQGNLISANNTPATHLLFKGGLYFISLDQALTKLQKYNYNTQVFRKDVFMGQPVYVIGEDTNQFWLHAKEFYCIRRISTTSNGRKLDAVYADFKRLGKGWVEQKVTFYLDNQKRLEEFYFDIKLKNHIDPKTFDVKKNNKWFLNY
ncbi:hypothetical protein GTQ40_17315 [Flavobacteriaceae bacterium R38]|nr:hypothetical protein [Flavobacteriaceae bacterium R38]